MTQPLPTHCDHCNAPADYFVEHETIGQVCEDCIARDFVLVRTGARTFEYEERGTSYLVHRKRGHYLTDSAAEAFCR